MVSESLKKFRQQLHQCAEISGKEQDTAHLIYEFLQKYNPDAIITNLGGFGLAAIYNASKPGPTVAIRCELDALPIPETIDIAYCSKNKGISHKCGHDGHMAVVAGLAPFLSSHRPKHGRVILLFQPAEETGEGANEVLQDSKFSSLAPDYIFALHNVPGYSQGELLVCKSVFSCASKGMIIQIKGHTSHASQPEKGNSPTLAMIQIMQVLNSIPQFYTAFDEMAQITIVHANLGKATFGISPGEATIMATLRAGSQQTMEQLTQKCLSIACSITDTYKLTQAIEFKEVFPVTQNHKRAINLIEKAASKLQIKSSYMASPFPWSEDFGHFTSLYPGAMFGLGAGKEQPDLHSPNYDFPETLLEPGINMFREIIQLLVY